MALLTLCRSTTQKWQQSGNYFDSSRQSALRVAIILDFVGRAAFCNLYAIAEYRLEFMAERSSVDTWQQRKQPDPLYAVQCNEIHFAIVGSNIKF